MKTSSFKHGASLSPRLTIGQTTHLCNQQIGRLRADTTFPPMINGTFAEAAVLAWIAARDAKAATPTPIPQEDANVTL